MEHMDVEAIEGFAALALREARMDGDDRPDARLLCKRLGMTIVLSPASRFVGRNHAQVGTLDGRPIIRIRKGLAPWLERFNMLHEAAHVMLARWAVEREDEEEIANGMAGAMSIPRDSLRHVWRRGADLRDVIESWPDVGPTCCALRLGEGRFADTAVTVGRKVLYVRSERHIDRALVDLAAEASSGALAVFAGARAYPLADGRRRAAVVVDLAA